MYLCCWYSYRGITWLSCFLLIGPWITSSWLDLRWIYYFYSSVHPNTIYSFYMTEAGKCTLLINITNAIINNNNNKWQLFAFSPKAFLTYTSSVQVGARSGIQECKHQFMLEKWNCPESTLQLSTHNGLRSGKTLVSTYLRNVRGNRQMSCSVPATVSFAEVTPSGAAACDLTFEKGHK